MRLLILRCLSFTSTLLFAENSPTELTSKIEKVIVFKQGAQVTRLAQTTIPKGRTVFKFTNLPLDFNAKSLQLKAEGDFTVLSIQL